MIWLFLRENDTDSESTAANATSTNLISSRHRESTSGATIRRGGQRSNSGVRKRRIQLEVQELDIED